MQNGLRIEPETVCSKIERFIKDKVNELHREGVALGLSGGIDSSVVAYLASRALGPTNILCLILPEKHSSTESQKHARLIVDSLGTDFHVEDLTPKLNRFGIYRFVPSKVPGFLARRVLEHCTRELGGSLFSEGSPGSKNKLAAKANAF